MLISWSIGSIFFFTYGTVQGLPISLTLEPAFFIIFATICWAQCVQYNRGRWQERMQKIGLTNPFLVWFVAFITMLLIMGLSLYVILIGMQVSIMAALFFYFIGLWTAPDVSPSNLYKKIYISFRPLSKNRLTGLSALLQSSQ